MIEWRCRVFHCNHLLRVPDFAAGRRVRCPMCGDITVAHVPAADTPPWNQCSDPWPRYNHDHATRRSALTSSRSRVWAVRTLATALVCAVAALLLIFSGTTEPQPQPNPPPTLAPPVQPVPTPPKYVPLPVSPGPAAEPTASGPVSPMKAKEREIFREHKGEPGNPELGQQYDLINASFFDGTLPTIPVIWESRLRDLGRLDRKRAVLQGATNGHLILLNSDLMDDLEGLKRTLSHEMVHVYLINIGDTTEDHGPTFQAILRRLSEHGAFEGIFATEAEKARLRAALDFESARLDVERRELDRVTAELEDMRRDVRQGLVDSDWFNRQVSDRNYRTQRLRLDVAAYNSANKRYELMMVYPDGLNGESLANR